MPIITPTIRDATGLQAFSAAQQAAARDNYGLGSAPSAFSYEWARVCGLLPAAAMDFCKDRYSGGASLSDIQTARSVGTHQWKDSLGNVLQFAANQVRRSDLGLYLDANDTCTLSGVLAAIIQANATNGFTILAEFGVSELVENTYDVTTGPNNQVLIGGMNGSSSLIGRGGNGALAQAYNGVPIVGQSNSPGNGRLFDTATQAVALSCDAAGNRAISNGGGTVVTGTGGIGTFSTIYLGKLIGGGTQSTGMILRSLRVWVGAVTNTQLQQMCFYPPGDKFGLPIGDSLAAGAGASNPSQTSWFARVMARFNPDGIYSPMGYGGDTSKMAQDRFNGITNGSGAVMTDPVRLREKVPMIWTAANDPDARMCVDMVRSVVDGLTGEKKYLVLSPLQNTGNAPGSAGFNKILAARDNLKAFVPPSRYVDIFAAMNAAFPNDANVLQGYTPISLLADAIHINDNGHAFVDPLVYGAWVANGF